MKPLGPPSVGPLGPREGPPSLMSQGPPSHIEAAPGEEAFGESPTQTLCPHCSKAITTTVRFKRSCIGVSSCLAAFLFLGWVGLCLGPFLWIALRVRHIQYTAQADAADAPLTAAASLLADADAAAAASLVAVYTASAVAAAATSAVAIIAAAAVVAAAAAFCCQVCGPKAASA